MNVSLSTLLVKKTGLPAPKTRTHTKVLKGSLPIEGSTHQLKELLVGLVKELVKFLEDGGGHVWVGSALGVV